VRVAVVHYWFITRRGGEKVVESILELYPQADIYTLFYDKKKYGKFLENHKVYTSSFNNSFFRKFYQKLFPLYPLIIKSLKLKQDYDLIISSESGPAKGITIRNKAKHVCYIHSPMRYCWGFTDEYLKSMKPIFRPIANFFFNRLREWDKTTIDNVNLYIANSINVAERVKEFYNKDAKVIYPPIETSLFKEPLKLKKEKKDYFLSFGAITPYKKIDLLVDCFNDNGQKLVIIGDGSEREKLEKKSNKNIEFKGFLNEKELARYVNDARALIFPGEEDFGMIPLEVMAKGIPVIAFKKGGALETVIENKKDVSKSSGIFFKNQSISSLKEAINYFSSIEAFFDPEWIRKHAQSFDETKFLYRFSQTLEEFLEKK
jgi:glycosyltransferase involved in cell wall biosynthesis